MAISAANSLLRRYIAERAEVPEGQRADRPASVAGVVTLDRDRCPDWPNRTLADAPADRRRVARKWEELATVGDDINSH